MKVLNQKEKKPEHVKHFAEQFIWNLGRENM